MPLFKLICVEISHRYCQKKKLKSRLAKFRKYPTLQPHTNTRTLLVTGFYTRHRKYINDKLIVIIRTINYITHNQNLLETKVKKNKIWMKNPK